MVPADQTVRAIREGLAPMVKMALLDLMADNLHSHPVITELDEATLTCLIKLAVPGFLEEAGDDGIGVGMGWRLANTLSYGRNREPIYVCPRRATINALNMR
jgi:hypothetical protein